MCKARSIRRGKEEDQKGTTGEGGMGRTADPGRAPGYQGSPGAGPGSLGWELGMAFADDSVQPALSHFDASCLHSRAQHSSL